ncbi:diacylglycerol kinase [Vibrio scophthalmi]|uniref:Diacylglycerol kinase n=1 Tax=Vibrio scophthalmi TaxID=45658 RepID=A0A1E3WSD3_9VIBR|nr:diacylglycerol kinase [Vibrio scophthalmi]MCY9805300.1 diacylglycerol kinase [Vibrio scophthalmi]ODS12663.1 Diacylglycerol kinase (ATP) [Vibrio scophthalmi]
MRENKVSQKTKHGFKRLFNATRFSYQGLQAAFKTEAAFREELILACIMIPLAFWLDVSQIERILMIACVVLVMVMELINSAIEAVVDRIGTEHHELSGKAKDIGSATVMLTMLLTVYVWVEILFL